MKACIVRIGNSKGIRIPKPILEQTGLAGEVEIAARNGSVVIRAASRPRAGWAPPFATWPGGETIACLDDVPATLSTWDEEEWRWR